jgi:hypothetical protein
MRNQIPIGKRNLHAGNFAELRGAIIRVFGSPRGALTIFNNLMAPDLPLYK